MLQNFRIPHVQCSTFSLLCSLFSEEKSFAFQLFVYAKWKFWHLIFTFGSGFMGAPSTERKLVKWTEIEWAGNEKRTLIEISLVRGNVQWSGDSWCLISCIDWLSHGTASVDYVLGAFIGLSEMILSAISIWMWMSFQTTKNTILKKIELDCPKHFQDYAQYILKYTFCVLFTENSLQKQLLNRSYWYLSWLTFI